MERIIRKISPPATLIPKRERVAAYARVSSGKDAMLHSLSAQVSYCSNYIQKHKEWQYVGVYADEALTGTKDTRTEFQRLLADCRAGLIDLVDNKIHISTRQKHSNNAGNGARVEEPECRCVLRKRKYPLDQRGWGVDAYHPRFICPGRKLIGQ